MKLILKTMACLSFGLWSGAVCAQATTAADIAAMVDEKMSGIDEYAALLSDPDPERALAAMQIMIGLDDPQISRMALQHGLTSTSPAVRKAALTGFFDGGPNIGIYLDGSKLEQNDFPIYVTRAGGSVDGNAIGYLTYKVGPYDAENSCYDYIPNPAYCLIKVTEDSVSVQLWGKWSSMRLNADGVLEGAVHVDRLMPAAPATLPVRQ